MTVVTLGPAVAEEQLRACLALGAPPAVLIETGGLESGPIATAAALAAPAGGRRPDFDLVLLGNEASDTGDYQVGIRVAHLLGWPAATGIKALGDDRGLGVGVADLPGRAGDVRAGAAAVVTVKEGINLPRYPSLPGRLRAKRASIKRCRVRPPRRRGVRMTSLRVPDAPKKQATVLGTGARGGAGAGTCWSSSGGLMRCCVVELDGGPVDWTAAAVADVSLRALTLAVAGWPRRRLAPA